MGAKWRQLLNNSYDVKSSEFYDKTGFEMARGGAGVQIIPFSQKKQFSPKIYGFFEIFLAKNNQKTKLHRIKAFKICLGRQFRKFKIPPNST